MSYQTKDRKKSRAQASKIQKLRQRKLSEERERKTTLHQNLPQIPLNIRFQPAKDYSPKKKLNICHVIDNLSMGGAQVMMGELLSDLKKTYPDTSNILICLANPNFRQRLAHSYGFRPIYFPKMDLEWFLKGSSFDIIVQHRTAESHCLRSLIPDGMKYILVNHTYSKLDKMNRFGKCDFYVSVCQYLDRKTPWANNIHPSRRAVILNGVEKAAKKPAEIILKGTLRSGRCHRLVPDKFRMDSLKWMENVVKKELPGHHHYLIGNNSKAQEFCSKTSSCHYLGEITHKEAKIGIISQFDVYFYETFAPEGASMAILESLSCGIPVICRDFGGNSELIVHGMNGFIEKDRKGFLKRLKELSDPDVLCEFKKRTSEDYWDRLHINNTTAQYMQLFEQV